MVVASVSQGHAILGIAREVGHSPRPRVRGKAIETNDGQLVLVDGLQMTVLGPLKKELDELRARCGSDSERTVRISQRLPGTLLTRNGFSTGSLNLARMLPWSREQSREAVLSS